MVKQTAKLANKASTQTAAQAAAAIDERAGVKPEPTLAESMAARMASKTPASAKAGISAFDGRVDFHPGFREGFYEVARVQVQRFITGMAGRMDDGVVECDADVLEDIDATAIKPYAKSQTNDVIGHYAAPLLGLAPWTKYINATKWEAFKRAEGLTSDFYPVFRVTK
tara:strand:- start:42 stop:545 length:504 start_codon:yes stop_codon:yes gene_type:complete